MGACATKSGDLKVKGEPPLVVDDAVAPPVAEAEKVKADVVPPATEADSADVSRRRSLSVLLKEDAEASDGEAGQEVEKVVTVDTAVATDEAGAPASLSEEAEAAKAPQQVAVEPTVATKEQDTAEQLTDDPKAGQEPGGDGNSEDGQEAEKVVTVDSAGDTDEAGAPASLSKEAEAAKAPQQVAVEPSVIAEEQDTAEQPNDDTKAGQEPGGNAEAAEEEKQVDPDSVQVAVAAAPTPSAEESKAADGDGTSA